MALWVELTIGPFSRQRQKIPSVNRRLWHCIQANEVGSKTKSPKNQQ
jgi:hypothetical protein